MSIIDYSRSVLTVLQVRSSTLEELIGFLHSHGETHYELASGASDSGGPVFLRDLRKGSMLRVPYRGYFVWDPESRTMTLYENGDALRAIGVDPQRIRALASGDDDASWHLQD